MTRLQIRRAKLVARMQQAVRLRQHKLQAEIGVELRAVTLRQLQSELRAERKAFRAAPLRGCTSRHKAATARKRAKIVAQKLKEAA